MPLFHLVRVIGAQSEALVSKAPGQVPVTVAGDKDLKIDRNVGTFHGITLSLCIVFYLALSKKYS